MNLSWNLTRGSNLLISPFFDGGLRTFDNKILTSPQMATCSFVLDVLTEWKSKAEQDIWSLFFFWNLPTRMAECCKTYPVCVELGSRDKEQDSMRLQVEMLERNECIRSFHIQRIDLYFCDKEPNHGSVWSLSFLSSCLSLHEHAHTQTPNAAIVSWRSGHCLVG